MKISDLLGRSAIDYESLTRAADALRPMTEIMSSSAALALEAQSHREWLDTSLAAIVDPRIDLSQFASSVDTMLGVRSSLDQPFAAAALGPSYDFSGITRLTAAANLAMGLGVQKGIQDAIESFGLPLNRVGAALEAMNRITADSVFRDFDRFAGIGESVLQRYAGWSGIFDIPFEEDLLEAAEEGITVVRAELALDQPLSETNLPEAIQAVLQRVQALADNPALQKAVLRILTLVVGNLLSGVVGAEWTLQQTEGERLRAAAEQHVEVLHEEEQTEAMRRLEEQFRIVAEATELRAVITRSAHLRARPDSVSSSYTQLSPGDTVLIREQQDGWLRVTAHVPEKGLLVGWVYAKRAKAVLE